MPRNHTQELIAELNQEIDRQNRMAQGAIDSGATMVTDLTVEDVLPPLNDDGSLQDSDDDNDDTANDPTDLEGTQE